MYCQFSKEFSLALQPQLDGLCVSGAWEGYYVQSGIKHKQSLELHFLDSGFEGTGQDGIGMFLIMGSFDRRAQSAKWVKRYIGRHYVLYEGKWNGAELIGRWTIPGLGSDSFAIQPRRSS